MRTLSWHVGGRLHFEKKLKRLFALSR